VAALLPGAWNNATADREGERLDVAIARLFPELSRSRVQKLIEQGHVRLNGQAAKANLKPETGDRIELYLPPPRPLDLKAESIPLEILFQDEHLAVIEKPAGLVVHPAAGHEEGTLVHALLHHFGEVLARGSGIGGELRPGIVHRIDKNTSGILLVTKTDLAHHHLSRQFKDHSITRRYTGLCWGGLPASGEWNEAIARDPRERKRMALMPAGRPALTRYRRKEIFPGAALFEAELFTGRTHQIRVHFSAHGFPLVGDPVYGNATRAARRGREEGARALQKKCPSAVAAAEALQEAGRQFLHASHLGFAHPVNGSRLEFTSELPPDLNALVLELRSCRTS
jgi:23S rRNA pseudouridine1911/1915/1917 synthase